MKVIDKSRIPSDLLDDFRIFCFRLREKGFSLHQIAMKLGKDHTTILYHSRKCEDFSKFNKEFKFKVKEFNEEEFVKKYQKYRERKARIIH